MLYRFADSLLASRRQTCMTHTIAVCTVEETPDDGHRNCPKHVEFYSKNKIWEISASGWFYYKNLSRCTVTWTSDPRYLYSVYFVQSPSTCFGHVCSPSSGRILYIYNNWYVLCFFSWNVCWPGWVGVPFQAGQRTVS